MTLNSRSSSEGSGWQNSTNSKPSVPIGFSSEIAGGGASCGKGPMAVSGAASGGGLGPARFRQVIRFGPGRFRLRPDLARELEVLLHPAHDQPQHVEAEARLLEVELAELVIGEEQDLDVAGAARRDGAAVVGREQAHLAEEGAGADAHADLLEQDLARDERVGLGRGVA